MLRKRKAGPLGVVLALLLASLPSRADEGMWPFNYLPLARWRERYGFEPSESWLRRLQRASVRVATCSGSFVSSQGLTLTNQHCVVDCLARLSSPGRDRLAGGFHAREQADELRCPGYAIQQLEQIEDVTARIRQATRGLEGIALEHALDAETARIEGECSRAPAQSCELVSSYRGGRYELYRYRRYDDVRMVFAPEHALAQFGGDPDNFNFPRFALDFALLRAYEGARPAATAEHLSIASTPLALNELVFAAGSPGSTDRLRTVAELGFLRDRALVEELTQLATYRGFLAEYGRTGGEAARQVMPDLLRVENLFKELRGARAALLEPRFFQSLAAREAELRARVAAKPTWQREYGSAWSEIERLLQQALGLGHEWLWIEGPAGYRPPWAKSELLLWARFLVRAASERQLDNAARLPEYADARLPALERRLLGERPLDRELEARKLALGLRELREALGVDHPFVRKVLGQASPAERARELVFGSTLHRREQRERLWRGGQAAVLDSRDRLIQLALAIDGDGRALRVRQQAEIESVLTRSSERIARARFAVHGDAAYPDATGSPRVSYGTVRGWRERNGQWVPAFTTLAGLFARATGRAPYALPRRWLERQRELQLDTPFNFASDADVVGGNSGSPLVDRRGQLVGLIFDGNLPSLGGAYGFDPATNRAVALDVRALLHALDVVYGARRLTAELKRPAGG